MNRDTLFQITKFLNRKELVTYISSNKLFNGYFNCYKVYIMFHIFGNEIIKKVINKWSSDELMLLFSIKDFDITYDNNYTIRMAAKNGHLNILKYLYENTKADLTARNIEANANAVIYGYLDIFKYICENTVVDYNIMILDAAINGRLNIVKYLCENTEADPTCYDNEAIRLASKKGHLDVVTYLCENTTVDPTANNYEAFKQAIVGGHLDIVNYIQLTIMKQLNRQLDGGHLDIVNYLKQKLTY